MREEMLVFSTLHFLPSQKALASGSLAILSAPINDRILKKYEKIEGCEQDMRPLTRNIPRIVAPKKNLTNFLIYDMVIMHVISSVQSPSANIQSSRPENEFLKRASVHNNHADSRLV